MLDITPGAIPQVVKVSEYDVNRAYTVTLVDEGGVFEIPSGTTATVEGTIKDSPFSEAATVSGNTIVFELSENMTAYAGDAWVKIKLTKDSKPIQTAAFILRCDKAGAEADTIISASGFQGQIDEAVAKRFDTNLKILVLGNSFSQDAFAYLPPVLNELLPGYNITYGVAYTASCGAIKHLEMYENDQNYDNFHLWRAGADHWSRYAGSGVAGYSLRKIMAAYDWDIVYMQSRGSIAVDAMEQDMMDENITPGRELLRILQEGINSHFVFLTGQWLSFIEQSTGDTLASYFRMRKAIKYVADRLGVDGVIPIGAGIAFARMDTDLDELGENGHLLYDTHQQAGLPALISTYVIAQYLLKMMGRAKSVYTSSFAPSAENVTAINCTRMTHGDPVGVTAGNILKAQEIAVAAVAHPDSVYGEVDAT